MAIALPPRSTSTPTPGHWSKEAILALLGIAVALLCCLIGLAWPSVRMWLFACRSGSAAPVQNVTSADHPGTMNGHLVPVHCRWMNEWKNGKDEIRRLQQEEYSRLVEVRRERY
ncbi:hypothetical protein BDW02DRAFT_572985 [Decorospora gaudefroyi]|uniref:Uncharacterized protein n=1 Tax=Decorospora gaudefroyi TaxID=184978 RepID=A0A6A5JZ65_9PLEO|nr:hypothetical protein BDW02DRAFT_572985 [Decorospora gaudefroyi]